MRRIDLTPRGRQLLAACIGHLFNGQSFVLDICGKRKFLCYRGEHETLPRVPLDVHLLGAGLSGLYVTVDRYRGGLQEGEMSERCWMFAGNLDELHLVLDGNELDVEAVLEAMAEQATFSAVMRSVQPGRALHGEQPADADFLEVDCIMTGDRASARQQAQIQSGEGAEDGIEIGGARYALAQLEAAVGCAVQLETAYAQASEDNGGGSSVDWDKIDRAHSLAHEVFSEIQLEAFQQTAREHNGYQEHGPSEKP